jgi:hypothetical protein
VRIQLDQAGHDLGELRLTVEQAELEFRRLSSLDAR